jgi:murein DD-endopeptidase MepM/ murein hydrolase activator NlpD
MAISEKQRALFTKYLLLAGICITFQAFIMKPEKKIAKPAPTVYTADASKYFKAPELPERFCNTIPKKIAKKSKRIKSTVAAKAVAIPRLLIPVVGATKRSIISFYGDARDGGRKHEGIDIVAPKGTFVVAPSAGEVTNVGYNSLGGKVIWIKDIKQTRSYYFAHLDSQIVAKGMIVKPGDTLGTVGNTGNARRTRAHLHFGIYTKDGRTPVDYIRNREQVITMLAASE